jgi:hypothetical protein
MIEFKINSEHFDQEIRSQYLIKNIVKQHFIK